MAKVLKFRASKQDYVPQSQLIIDGFENPFVKQLDPSNRWVVMASRIPWDEIVPIYASNLNNKKRGAKGINPRVALGAMIIKHTEGWIDPETVQHIQENMFLQYFIGLTSFVKEPIFDPLSFVDFGKRISLETFEKINTVIVKEGLKMIEPDLKDEKKVIVLQSKWLRPALICKKGISFVQ